MLPEKIEKFREIVLRDFGLRERLRETSERAEFVQMIIKLGAERGFEFTAEEIEEAMRQARRGWLDKWK